MRQSLQQHVSQQNHTSARRTRPSSPALAVQVLWPRTLAGEPHKNEQCVCGTDGVHDHDVFAGTHHALLTQAHTQAGLDLKLRSKGVGGCEGGALQSAVRND